MSTKRKPKEAASSENAANAAEVEDEGAVLLLLEAMDERIEDLQGTIKSMASDITKLLKYQGKGKSKSSSSSAAAALAAAAKPKPKPLLLKTTATTKNGAAAAAAAAAAAVSGKKPKIGAGVDDDDDDDDEGDEDDGAETENEEEVFAATVDAFRANIAALQLQGHDDPPTHVLKQNEYFAYCFDTGPDICRILSDASKDEKKPPFHYTHRMRVMNEDTRKFPTNEFRPVKLHNDQHYNFVSDSHEVPEAGDWCLLAKVPAAKRAAGSQDVASSADSSKKQRA